MKRIDPTFSYEVEGFRSFRQLLENAESEQIIVVERPLGASDLIVRATAQANDVAVARSSAAHVRINPDLWQALLDWNPNARYLFSRVQNRPIKSATLAEDSNNVLVPSITRDEQLEWMREFAAAQVNEDLKQELLDALNEEVPVRGFSRAVRHIEAAGRRWKRYLQRRVLERATTWAAAQSIPLSAIESVETPAVTEGTSSQSSTTAEVAAGELATKARVLSILASMPLGELLRLPIPVEYALRQ
jgi:hypothetical protein